MSVKHKGDHRDSDKKRQTAQQYGTGWRNQLRQITEGERRYGAKYLDPDDLQTLRAHIKYYEKPGEPLSGRLDFYSLMSDAESARLVSKCFSQLYNPDSYDVIVAVAETGLCLAMMLQAITGKIVVPLRRVGKTPGRVVQIAYEARNHVMECAEVSAGVLQPGMRVLIVDDYLGTGCTIRAALDLVQDRFGCSVTGIAVFTVLRHLRRRQNALRGCEVCIRSALTYQQKPPALPLQLENTSARVEFYQKGVEQ